MISTYWGKTKFAEKQCKGTDYEKEELAPPWELLHSPDKGFYAIATRNFQAGELICREYPVATASVWPFSRSEAEEAVLTVSRLPEEERNAFFQLSNVYSEEEEVEGIFKTNSFDMTCEGDERASGMYLAIARLNHSCRPNAQQTHIPSTKEEVLYATRHIKRGEEICDCYIELRQSKEDRQRELKKLYRFTCCCPSCELPENRPSEGGLCIEKDDKNRINAMRLEKEMMNLAEMGLIQKAMDTAKELIQLLEHPESIGWGERFLADTYLCMFHFSCSLYKLGYDCRKWRQSAEHFVNEAHNMNIKLQGHFSPDSCRTKQYKKRIDEILNS